MSEPTPRAAEVRRRTLLRWRVHGAETAAVALGTAAVAMQGARLGPWLTDDAGVALAVARGAVRVPAGGEAPAPAAAPGWLWLLELAHPAFWALLCFAGALWATTGTVRAVRGRRAWPFTLGAAAVFAACPPALGWLFAGEGGALSLLAVTVLLRAVVGAAARGRLPYARTAAGVGLLAGLGACAMPAGLAGPAGLALAAVYPAARLLAWRQGGSLAAALWSGVAYGGAWAVSAAVSASAVVSAAVSASAEEYVVACCAAVALALGAASRLASPARLAGVAAGTALLVPSPDGGIPGAVALAMCGALLLVGRGASARVVGAVALAAAVGWLWVGALGFEGAAALLACALPTTAALLSRTPPPSGTAGHGPGGRAPLRRERVDGPRARAGGRGFRAGPGRGTRRGVVVGVAVVGTVVAGVQAAAPPTPGDALCFTEARYGRMFATYAERLGLDRSAVALASPGGVLALGEQHAVDLRGRTDPRIAAARAAHDDAALRRHLFVRVRPEFVHVDAADVARTGLTARRLDAHGYRPLLRKGAGGDYVHRSAVTVPERLPRLRAWARGTADRLEGCATRR